MLAPTGVTTDACGFSSTSPFSALCIFAVSSAPTHLAIAMVPTPLPMVLVIARASDMKRSTPNSNTMPATGMVPRDDSVAARMMKPVTPAEPLEVNIQLFWTPKYFQKFTIIFQQVKNYLTVGVDQFLVDFHVRKVLGHLVENLVPQHHAVTLGVGFGEHGQVFARTALRQFEGKAVNALDPGTSEYRDFSGDLFRQPTVHATAVAGILALGVFPHHHPVDLITIVQRAFHPRQDTGRTHVGVLIETLADRQPQLLRAEWDIARYVRSGRLRLVLEDQTPTRADVYAVYPQQLHLSARVRSLIDFLIERFKHIDNVEDS